MICDPGNAVAECWERFRNAWERLWNGLGTLRRETGGVRSESGSGWFAQDLGLDFERRGDLAKGAESRGPAGLDACNCGTCHAAALGELVLGEHAPIAPVEQRRRRSQGRTRHPLTQATGAGRFRDSVGVMDGRHVAIVRSL